MVGKFIFIPNYLTLNIKHCQTALLIYGNNYQKQNLKLMQLLADFEVTLNEPE